MQKQVVIGSQLISYIETGSKEAEKTLLFLHGWRSQKEIWNEAVSRIKDYGSRIITLDLPGFGQSPVPREAWSVGDYAELVKTFIEKLELKNVILVGHSFGGRVGIKLCAAQNHNPPLPSFPPAGPGRNVGAGGLSEGTIQKLILVDAAGFVYTGTKRALVNSLAKMVKPFFKPKFMQGLRSQIYKAMDSEDYLHTPELRTTYVKIISEDLSEDMKRIKVPTLIITGENDKDTPVEFGQRMNSLIPNSKFLILKNAGHFSFLDQPEEFLKELLYFIN